MISIIIITQERKRVDTSKEKRTDVELHMVTQFWMSMKLSKIGSVALWGYRFILNFCLYWHSGLWSSFICFTVYLNH